VEQLKLLNLLQYPSRILLIIHSCSCAVAIVVPFSASRVAVAALGQLGGPPTHEVADIGPTNQSGDGPVR